jgi:hypothetical protein
MHSLNNGMIDAGISWSEVKAWQHVFACCSKPTTEKKQKAGVLE